MLHGCYLRVGLIHSDFLLLRQRKIIFICISSLSNSTVVIDPSEVTDDNSLISVHVSPSVISPL